MKTSEDLLAYSDGMVRDAINERGYKAGDLRAVAGYMKRMSSKVAQLEAENAKLKREADDE